MLLLIDNFDSFTYNLVHAFQVLGVRVVVYRNHRISLDDINKLNPTHVVISPGPGSPSQAGISKHLIERLGGHLPLLGVCLGHQCIGEVYGGNTVQAKRPMHGKLSRISHDGRGLFSGLKNHFLATRYHSLIVERDTLPSCLEISAETEEGEIMGLRHRILKNLEGVQFHPESIMTEQGMQILSNFLTKESLC